MNISTIISKTYAVTSITGCTVSTPSGVILLTVPENSQACFISPTSSVIVSDDTAIITPIT